jgi:NAD dependent epimerase/dehydratase family enzyme
MFQGTKLGHGQQGLSWIHVDDLVRLILEAIRNPAFEGAVNATSPRPVTNETFTRALARRLHRPMLPVPAFVTRTALEIVFGEMGREMLLEGAFVYPRKALELGFEFRFERVEDALSDLLGAP